MRNPERWRPTKFVKTTKGFVPSSDPQFLSPASRFIAYVTITHYETLIRMHARGRLLDLGCGDVPYFEIYRSYVTETVCVDWANSLHRNELLDLTANLNAKLPFEDDAFDTVLLTDVLEHLAEPALLISEMQRVLRPGGKALIAVPFYYWIHEEPHDYFRYTEYSLRRFCEANELQVVTLSPYGGLPEVFFDLSAKALIYLPAAISRVALRVHLACARLATSTTLCKRFSAATARTFPLGYCLVAQKAAASLGNQRGGSSEIVVSSRG